MNFYKLRYDKDTYLIFELMYYPQSVYKNYSSMNIKMMSVVEFNTMYDWLRSRYRNISLSLACKNIDMYLCRCYNDRNSNRYLEVERIYEYLESEYDEEKINSYILQEKELQKKDREERNRIAEEEKRKKKQEREEKRLRKIEEEKERNRRQAELLAKENEIYTREWKDRLNKFLNSVMDGTYNPPETKCGYIGFGVDNVSSAYKEHCTFGGYEDYEPERM